MIVQPIGEKMTQKEAVKASAESQLLLNKENLVETVTKYAWILHKSNFRQTDLILVTNIKFQLQL